jgi:hypothetical protein
MLMMRIVPSLGRNVNVTAPAGIFGAYELGESERTACAWRDDRAIGVD